MQTALEAWLIRSRAGPRRNMRQETHLAAVIARNVAIDLRRQRARARRVFAAGADPQRAADALPEATAMEPERVVAARELLEAFERALRTLPPTTARVIVLHDVFGLALDEVAEDLGISNAAAQSRLVRGRRALAALSWGRASQYGGARRRPGRLA